MSLFDAISSQVASSIASSAAGEGVMGAVAALLNDPQTDGLQGLVGAFEEQGLGNLIASWIGSGENLPISAAQLQSVLGSERIAGLAQQFGLSANDLSGQLANRLPELIDRLTPQGAIPEGALSGLMGLFKG